MSTVDWSGGGEGLRERKKRRTRQLLTDTATEMFLARGFEAVRVAEIAEACGVSEKTVYNYFPTKESLVLDHPDAAVAALRAGLADRSVPVIEAVLRILDGELRAVQAWLEAQPDQPLAVERFRSFSALVERTPALRAYQRDMADRLVDVAAQVLAERAGVEPEEPELRITAIALGGLWRVQFGAISRYVGEEGFPAAVADEVRRAADVVATGVGALTG